MSNINLLPKHIKEEIGQTKKNRKTRSYLIKTLLILSLTVILSMVLLIYFQKTEIRLEEEVAVKQEEINRMGNFEGEAKLLSGRLDTITQIIKKDTNYWSNTLEEITKVMPNGVYLTSLSLSPDAATRNRITGFAASKNVVAALRSSMDNSEIFEFVDIESSVRTEDSETKKEAENFVITFSLAKGVLND
jgi:Tfp pilus assembly protein PilN